MTSNEWLLADTRKHTPSQRENIAELSVALTDLNDCRSKLLEQLHDESNDKAEYKQHMKKADGVITRTAPLLASLQAAVRAAKLPTHHKKKLKKKGAGKKNKQKPENSDTSGTDDSQGSSDDGGGSSESSS